MQENIYPTKQFTVKTIWRNFTTSLIDHEQRNQSLQSTELRTFKAKVQSLVRSINWVGYIFGKKAMSMLSDQIMLQQGQHNDLCEHRAKMPQS